LRSCAPLHEDPRVPEQPAGSITLVFTDIEGSTQLLRKLGEEGYRHALAEQRRIVRDAFAAGYEVDNEGDSFFYAFRSAPAAVDAVWRAMGELAPGPTRVRVGIHTGEPALDPPKYLGLDVHLAARIMSAGHGGQVLLSGATRELLDGEADVRDLGEHRLKDFERPVALYQLGERPFPPLKTIGNTNLPRPASSFVGRERELEDVLAMLHDGARIVTLAGAGGSGKTRLAIEAAAELVGEFRAGVFWVGLAALNEPGLVLRSVSQVLGASDDLAGHIGDRSLLLLLDNFEQVVDAAPDLRDLVEACPNLKLLVTSRELMRVRGEVAYDVPPLERADAVSLFCVRAGIAPTPAVEELCRRLDDLPLAVELAAARVRVLTPEQILERLGNRLDLFRGGRDAELRQHTIRATIDWSYGLLSPEEQKLFARLAVFAGGCTLDAAGTVCDADLDTLQSLVEKSMLRHSGERFWMLEVIREYAVERLDATGDADELRRRYAEHVLELATTAGFAHAARMPERHDLVRAELANVRSALEWAVATDPELGARLATELEMFWYFVSPFEGRYWFEALLEGSGELSDSLRTQVIKCYGGCIWIVGDFDEGYRYYEQALELYRRQGDSDRCALMLPRMAAHLATRVGDTVRARAFCDESLEYFRNAGFEKGEAEALRILSYVEREEGEYARALELELRSEELAERVGWRTWQAGGGSGAAVCALHLNRPDEAATHARRSLALACAIGDRGTTAGMLAVLAECAATTGSAERAGRLFGAIEAEAERGRIGQWDSYRDEVVDRISVVAGPELEHGIAEGRALTFGQAVEFALSPAE
jgi:predicted ATPase/class 3 adenylate cyclase